MCEKSALIRFQNLNPEKFLELRRNGLDSLCYAGFTRSSGSEPFILNSRNFVTWDSTGQYGFSREQSRMDLHILYFCSILDVE